MIFLILVFSAIGDWNTITTLRTISADITQAAETGAINHWWADEYLKDSYLDVVPLLLIAVFRDMLLGGIFIGGVPR